MIRNLEQVFPYFVIITLMFMVIGLVLNIAMHKLSAKDTALSVAVQFFSMDAAIISIFMTGFEMKYFIIWQMPAMLILVIVAAFMKSETVKILTYTQNRIICVGALLYGILLVFTPIGPGVLNFFYPVLFVISELFVFGLIQAAFKGTGKKAAKAEDKSGQTPKSAHAEESAPEKPIPAESAAENQLITENKAENPEEKK